MVAVFDKYNTTGPTSLETLVSILHIINITSGEVHGDGKQISECTVDTNCLVI
jgi:hypothetical protein